MLLRKRQSCRRNPASGIRCLVLFKLHSINMLGRSVILHYFAIICVILRIYYSMACRFTILKLRNWQLQAKTIVIPNTLSKKTPYDSYICRLIQKLINYLNFKMLKGFLVKDIAWFSVIVVQVCKREADISNWQTAVNSHSQRSLAVLKAELGRGTMTIWWLH